MRGLIRIERNGFGAHGRTEFNDLAGGRQCLVVRHDDRPILLWANGAIRTARPGALNMARNHVLCGRYRSCGGILWRPNIKIRTACPGRLRLSVSQRRATQQAKRDRISSTDHKRIFQAHPEPSSAICIPDQIDAYVKLLSVARLSFLTSFEPDRDPFRGAAPHPIQKRFQFSIMDLLSRIRISRGSLHGIATRAPRKG